LDKLLLITIELQLQLVTVCAYVKAPLIWQAHVR